MNSETQRNSSSQDPHHTTHPAGDLSPSNPVPSNHTSQPDNTAILKSISKCDDLVQLMEECSKTGDSITIYRKVILEVSHSSTRSYVAWVSTCLYSNCQRSSPPSLWWSIMVRVVRLWEHLSNQLTPTSNFSSTAFAHCTPTGPFQKKGLES